MLGALTTVLSASVALAQRGGRVDLSWNVIGVGGGARSSASIEVRDTVGQYLIGRSQGDSVALNAGFWSIPGTGAAHDDVDWAGPLICPTGKPPVAFVDAEASPDIGALDATVLVAVGTRVRLEGQAFKLWLVPKTTEQGQPYCATEKETLPFEWTLTYQGPGNAPVNSSGMLSRRNTLTPEFMAGSRGVYVATLSADGKEAQVEIKVEEIDRDGTWVSIGPGNLPGPMMTLAIDPVTGDVYAGAHAGGIWKSASRGGSWQPLLDTQLASSAVRALALARPDSDPTTPPYIYAGIGDVWWNLKGGIDTGVFMSTDGGQKWQRSGADVTIGDNYTLRYVRQVSEIAAHPTNPQVLYAATTSGLFRTDDGGRRWDRIYAGEVDPDTGRRVTRSVTDVAITNPSNPLVHPTIYAAVPGIGVIRIRDNSPWQRKLLKGYGGGFDEVAVAVSESDPSTLYASFTRASRLYFALYRSSDEGSSWEAYSLPHYCGTQCSWNNVLAVGPADPDVVILGGVHLLASSSGGKEPEWYRIDRDNCGFLSDVSDCISPAEDVGTHMHVDHHAIVFDPSDPNVMYVANDGGVYRARITIGDIGQSVKQVPLTNFIPLNQGLVTTQIFRAAWSPMDPSDIALGLDHNGNTRLLGINPDHGAATTRFFAGGDGYRVGYDAISTRDAPVIYHDVYWGRNPKADHPNDNGLRRWSGATVSDIMVGLTSGARFADWMPDPYRAGSLLNVPPDGQLRYATNAHSASSTAAVIRQNIDPTPGNLEDWVTALTAVPPDGSKSVARYLVGTSDGAVYSVPVPGQAQLLYPVDPLPDDCARPIGRVRDIALDPRDSEVLYTTHLADVSTNDNTLRRLPHICQGDSFLTDYYDPSLEWQWLEVGAYDGLGKHTTSCGTAQELFMSEYVQGNGQEQALEIFNATGAAVDLTGGNYDVQIFENGHRSASRTIALAGTVENGAAYVVASKELATKVKVPSSVDQNASALHFSGNDAIVLRRNGIAIDSLGQVGFNPGLEWEGLSGRVMRLSKVAAGEYCGEDLSNQGSAEPGPPPRPGPTPVSPGPGPVPGPIESRNLPVVREVMAIASDPVRADTLYVATSGGLFQGKKGDKGTFEWEIAPGMPWVRVNDVKVHEGGQANEKVLRAVTFGRGLYELVRPSGGTWQSGDSKGMSQSGEDTVASCSYSDFTDATTQRDSARLEVDYTYESDHGETVRVRPVLLNNEVDSPYFLRQVETVTRGAGHASLLVSYAGADAPLSTQTDGVRVEFYVPGQEPFFSKVCRAQRRWRRQDGRALGVTANLRVGPSRGEIAVPISVQTDTAAEREITAFDLVMPQGATVGLTAPESYEIRGEAIQFIDWHIVGRGVESQPAVNLELSDDVRLVARYELADPTPKVFLVTEAHCGECAGNETVRVPVEISGSVRESTLVTPGAFGVHRGATVTLQAPLEVSVAGGYLQFLEWDIDGTISGRRDVSVAIDHDGRATARYRPIKLMPYKLYLPLAAQNWHLMERRRSAGCESSSLTPTRRCTERLATTSGSRERRR